MKLKSLKRKSVASVPVDFTGQAKKFAASVAENIDTLTGRRGNIIDRAVTFRDLLDAKVLKRVSGVLRSGGGDIEVVNPDDDDDLVDIPPAPTSLSAAGGFYIITLNWSLSKYSGHSHVEIYRHTSNSLSAAETSGVYDSYYGDINFYIDRQIGSSQTFYYWIRAVNKNDIAGPFNSGTGTSATSSVDYSHVNGLITSILNDASSNLGFRQRITGIENNVSTVTTSTNNLSSTVTSLNTTVGTNSASIQTNATSINGVEAKYSVKIDNNGHISGFGLLSTANNGTVTSSFIVAADRFAIARPFNDSDTNITTDYPFKVVSTAAATASIQAGVYIDDAFIHNGQITNAQIGDAVITNAKISDLSAGKITSGTITIDNSNSIAIQQGKTAYNTNTAGFWLGNDNGSGKFHVGASATSYLKFDGSNVETTGLVVKDPSNTSNTILSSGGAFDGSYISDLTVDTFAIKDEAIIAPSFTANTISSTTTISTSATTTIVTDTISAPSPASGNVRVLVMGSVDFYPANSDDRGLTLQVWTATQLNSSSYVPIKSYAVQGTYYGSWVQPMSQDITAQLRVICTSAGSKSVVAMAGKMVIMTIKK